MSALIPVLSLLSGKLSKPPVEKFGHASEKDVEADATALANKINIIVIVSNVINTILFAVAIFLAFRRNGGFEIGSFLAACCCSLCYIVYALAVPAPPRPAQ